jgi:hypothetical protein
VSLVESAGDRVVFTVAAGVGEPILGPALPAAAVRAYRHAEILSSTDKSAPMLTDGDVDTTWSDFPQTGGQWIDVDLGGTREVGGVICTLGRSYLAFPRRLRVETSLDATTWSTAWEGSGAVAAFLAMVRAPLVGDMRVGFEPRAARYVRLSQTADAAVEWRLADVSVRAPASR